MATRRIVFFIPYLLLVTGILAGRGQSFAAENSSLSVQCGDMETWDYGMGMCMPMAMAGMPMKMIMFHGNSFFMETLEEKPRGRDAFSVPDMFMLDVGSSVGDRHYFNLDFMGTAELWTVPNNGTPEFLQIGENQSNGIPFLDAQHPHSSPVMGLTLSDTISLSAQDHVKFSFAPRGESTDGPIAFMHRPTGMVNPDAPLGHHIGQDVGHISSTVLAGLIRLANTTLELSTFNGTEPSPLSVDLPMGTPNSYATRLTQQFTAHDFAMISGAYVKSPEPSEPSLDHVWRYSVSVYDDRELANGWMLSNALIWGLINGYDNAAALNSFAEEFWLHRDAHSVWGRLEELQRTPNELQIPGFGDADTGRWVTAATMGYTQKMSSWGAAEISLGGSVTKDFLPGDFQSAYSGNPVSGKIFVQVGGSQMWNL